MAKKESSAQVEAVYVISVAAALSGMHPQTLRIYERRGLIEPFRTPGGTRRYSEADLQRLALISELTSAGINLEGVKRILQLDAENAVLRAKVSRLRRALAESEKRSEQAVRKVHQSYRRELVVRQDVIDPTDLFT